MSGQPRKDKKDQGNEPAALLAQAVAKAQTSSSPDKQGRKPVPAAAPRPQSQGTSSQGRPIPKPTTTPKPKQRTVSSGGTTPKPVCLNISRIQAQDHRSLLASTLSQHTLPISIRLTKNFISKGSPVALKNGQVLLLCFVVEVPTVLASYEGSRDQYRLPLYANQRYERLPDGK